MESHARELARVPEPERAEVWRETVERTNGKPTAAAIRETYRPGPVPGPVPEPERAGAPGMPGLACKITEFAQGNSVILETCTLSTSP
ncbi:hypothetical protein [Actinomadura chokoriensis]|uniref:Uncharacterized protein n=1 Tax=Actinomadura chokoriensis TaxID=454156 RepID=A0ABV4RC98_9ACTN